MTGGKRAIVAVLSGNFDKKGVGQEKLLEALRGVEGILVVDRPEGPYGLSVESPAQICIIVNPDGRELAKLAKNQIAIATVDPDHHPYPTSLLYLGFDNIASIAPSKLEEEIDVRGLRWLLERINEAVGTLNWRCAILGSNERFERVKKWGLLYSAPS